jgi:hypothetical protein
MKINGWHQLSEFTARSGQPRENEKDHLGDGERPSPGGWNRIHLVVEDLSAEVARLRAAGV